VGLVVAAALVGLSAVVGYRLLTPRKAQALPPAVAAAPGAAAGFNVVLFTLDTLRADRLGCYGYRGVHTPAIDRLAAEGVRFADAVTAVPLTLPSHATILTGRYPPIHGVRDNGTYALAPEWETLAERLKAAGYETAAFVAASVVDRQYGLAQGFDTYDDQIPRRARAPGIEDPYPQRRGDVVVDAAIEWLNRYRQRDSGQPFFIWIHLFDPHTPYDPPEPFRSQYAASPYDGEVAFTDAQVGRFVDRLGVDGVLARTLIAAVGDHGEGLGEHNELNHGLLIYDSTMRVPFILHASSVLSGSRVVDDRVVATVDLMPTILDLLGLETGPTDGTSLLRPGCDPERAVYVGTMHPNLQYGWSPLYGLRRHNDKYIDAPTPEYYDLRVDAGETRNLAPREPAGAEELRTALAELRDTFPNRGDPGPPTVTPDAQALRDLAALGYVGNAPPQETPGPLPDPKDVIAAWQERTVAEGHVRAGRWGQAIPALETLLQKNPNDVELRLLYSRTLARAGKPAQAVASLQGALERTPDQVDLWIELAALQTRQGDRAGADASIERALQLAPESGAILLLRAQQELVAERYDQALALCEQARERDPGRAESAWVLAAQVWEKQGRPESARKAYERAWAIDPRSAAALLGLARFAEADGKLERAVELAGDIPRGAPQWPAACALLARDYVRLGQADLAVELMADLVQRHPTDPAAHLHLGNVLCELNRPDEAAACYRAAIQRNPNYAIAHYNLATVLKDQGLTQAAIAELRKALELDPNVPGGLLELAQTLAAAGQAAEALQTCQRLVEASPQEVDAWVLAARLLSEQGQCDQAIALLRRAHGLLPDEIVLGRHLAWRLAVSPTSEPPEKEEALALALQACAANQEKPERFDTLAAAYAALGRFEEAVPAAERALSLARKLGRQSAAEQISKRLELYRQGKPYHECLPGTPTP